MFFTFESRKSLNNNLESVDVYAHLYSWFRLVLLTFRIILSREIPADYVEN